MESTETYSKFQGQPRTMLATEIKAKFKRGKVGQLKFGRGQNFDVDQMVTVADVLELRLTAQYGDDPLSMLHTRIYFTEPEGLEKRMYLLVIATKHSSPGGRVEQNEHATRASGRLEGCQFALLGV